MARHHAVCRNSDSILMVFLRGLAPWLPCPWLQLSSSTGAPTAACTAPLPLQYGHKSYGRWLDVLRRLMVVDGTPIKRNQVMVMKLATQYDSQLLHLLPGPGGRSKISELMGTTQINPKVRCTCIS